MNNQQYNQPEMEINLKEVIWDLLEQWKAVLIAAVLMALMVSGIKYYTAMNDYNEALAADKELSEERLETREEKIAEVLSDLSDEDHAMVQLILQQEAWLDNQTDYFNNSLLLSLDPNAQRQLTISYYLYNAEENAYNALCDAYISNLHEEEFADAIGKQLHQKTEEKYIKELIRGYYTPNYSDESTGELFNVVISLPDSANAAELEKEISALMNEYSKELSQKIAPHSLKLIKTDDTVSVNEQAASKRTNTINSINSLNSSITNNKKTMSETQKAAYERITSLMQIDANSDDSEEDKEIITKPGFSKKYAALGFLLGIMAYAFAILGMLIIRGRINYASELELYTGSRTLGEVYYPENSKGIKKLFKSPLVEKFRYKDLLNADEQLEKTIKTISAVCEHEGISELTLLSLTDKAQDLADRVEKEGIKVKIMSGLCENEQEMLSAKNVIFATDKLTRISDLRKLARLCFEYKINKLGGVFL